MPDHEQFRLRTAMGLCGKPIWSNGVINTMVIPSASAGKNQQWLILFPVPCYQLSAQKRTLLFCPRARLCVEHWCGRVSSLKWHEKKMNNAVHVAISRVVHKNLSFSLDKQTKVFEWNPIPSMCTVHF